MNETLRMVKTAVGILLFFNGLLKLTYGRLQIELRSDLIIFNNTVILTCSSNESSLSSKWQWFVGDNLLFINGYPADHTDTEKFSEETLNSTHRRLNIRHFIFSDVRNYTCTYLLKSASLDLSEYMGKLIYLDYSIKTTISNNGAVLVVDISDISPVPTCSLILENKSVPIQKHNVTTHNFLYDVTFKIYIDEHIKCRNTRQKLKVICDMNSVKFNEELYIKLTELQSTCSHKDSPIIIIVITTICIGVAVMIILMILVYRLRKKKDSKDGNYKSEELEQLHT